MYLIRRLWTDESGQDMIEYALLVTLITLALLLAMQLMGSTISGFFNTMSDTLSNLPSSSGS